MARDEGITALSRKPLEVAFLFDDHAYSFSDVLVVGALRGEWSPFIARTRGRRRQSDDPPPPAAAEEVVAFRRARRLEAASDLRAWLGERGLDENDLVCHALALARERAGSLPPSSGSVGGHPRSAADWWPEAVLSGDIERWAAVLERWVTASHIGADVAAGGDGPDAAGEEYADRVAALIDAIRESGVLVVAYGADERRIEMLARACLDYQIWAASAVAGPAIDRLIGRKRLGWTWLEYDAVIFKSESAAWEAALCVREDGERLEDVAARADAPVVRRSGRRQDLRLAQDSILMALAPGEVGGPVITDDEPILLRLRQAVAPAARDDEVRQLARAELIDASLAVAAAGRTRRVGKW